MPLTIIRKVTVSGGTVLRAANNLGDVGSAATSRSNLGVYGTSESYTQAEVNARRTALAAANAAAFNGTAGETIVNASALGTSDCTIVAIGVLNSYANFRTVAAGSNWDLVVDSDSAVRIYDAGLVSNPLITATTISLATPFLLVATRTSAGWSISKDAVTLSSRTATTGDLAAPSNSGTNSGDSANRWDGTLRTYFYNRALSNDEIALFFKTAAPAPSDYNSASNTSVFAGDDSTFAGAGSWSVAGGASISGGKLNIPAAGSANNSLAPYVRGRKYKFTITLDSLTAGEVRYWNGTGYVQFATTAGTYTVEFTALASGEVFAITSAGGDAVFDTALFYNLGLLTAPQYTGNGLVDRDTSGNLAHHVRPTSGVVSVLPDREPFEFVAQTNTNGNQQVLGASCVETNVELELWAWTSSSTATIDVGSASGGAQYVSAAALTTTPVKLTLVASITTTANLWVKGNNTNTVNLQVRGKKIGI